MKNNNATLQILVNILAIFGGLLAAALIIWLLFVFDFMESSIVQLVFGIGFCAAAIVASRTKVSRVLDAMLVALYFAGLYLLAILFEGLEWYFVGLAMAVVGAITFATAKKSFLPFVSVVIFNFALVLVSSVQEVYALANVFLMLWIVALVAVNHFEATLIVKYEIPYSKYKAMQGGLFTTIVLSIALSLHMWMSTGFFDVIYPETPLFWYKLPYIIVLPVVFMYVLFKIMRRLEVRQTYRPFIATLLFIVMGALTFWNPYLGTSLLLATTAWYYGYRIQATVAAICTAYYIIMSYYDMDLSLLTKSAILFFSGAILLTAWALYMKKKKKRYEQI